MIRPFSFEDGGLTYTCSAEARKSLPNEAWWFFAVSGDRQRYAPFQAAESDTRGSVQSRIVAYYTAMVAHRLLPPEPRHHWARRKPEDAAASPAPAPVILP